MEKNSLLVIIFETVCGLVCIALGIYYLTCGKGTNAAVFLVVGAACLVMAVRAFILMRKNKKKDEETKRGDKDK